MKCQILFSGKNRKNNTNFSSAEYAERVRKIKGLDALGSFFLLFSTRETIFVTSFVKGARLGGKFHPWYLPVVFTGLENTPEVANTGQLNFFTLK